MAVYYTKKCPHCNGVYERGKGDRERYGSPFKTCGFCGKHFVDTDYVEIGLLDNKGIKENSFGWRAPALIVLGIFFVVVAWGEATIVILLGLGMLAFGIYNIIYNIRWKPENDEDVQEMVKESKQRLSNPHYVIALWKNGCKVTPEIVAWAKKELAGNDPQADVLEKAKNSETNV